MRQAAFLAIILLLGGSGCERADSDRLARVGRRVGSNIAHLIPRRTPLGSAAEIARIDLNARVTARFASDRYLAPAHIEIAASGAVVHLSGRVADATLKRRALEIAESTIGVEKVIDEIEVAETDSP